MRSRVILLAVPAATMAAWCVLSALASDEDIAIADRHLRVSLEIPSGRLTVKDVRNGVVWRQHPPTRFAQGSQWGQVRTRAVPADRLIRLAGAVVQGQSIKARATWQGHPFEILFQLVPDDAALTVTIDTPEREKRLPWKPGWAGVVSFGDRVWEDPRGFSVSARAYHTFRR